MAQRELLVRLADLYGVQTTYYDGFGRHCSIGDEPLLLLLGALGAPVDTSGDVSEAVREREQALKRRFASPVCVAFHGEAAHLDVRVEAAHEDARLTLSLPDGRVLPLDLGSAPVVDRFESEGRVFVHKRPGFEPSLPIGYHRAQVSGGGRDADVWILSAPVAFHTNPRSWGVFCPLYALSSDRSAGVGDLSDLKALTDWVRARGGSIVSVLPLMAAFLDNWFEPSPYRPVSRLHYNEVYLDVTALTGRGAGGPAPEIPPGVREEFAALRRASEVDFRRVFALKRAIVSPLAEQYFRDVSIHEWSEDDERRSIAEYAHFRAAFEATGKSFREWPWEMQQGKLPAELLHTPSFRYHAYAQVQMREQLAALSGDRSAASPLYLDLPLGVHPDGFDAWKYRSSFIERAEVGAPPDGFFSKGQKWGFSPLDPLVMRETGYEYFARCLRAQMSVAGMLRIDHVMGLHRLFCVPLGYEATEGTYVQYEPEELYAVLSIESHRHRCMVVGEDLGTVPDAVRNAMGRHRVQRMYVFQFEVGNALERGVDVGEDFVASLNTHDVAPFAAFYSGLDIDQRLELGHLTPDAAAGERHSRAEMRRALKRRFLGEDGPDAEGDVDRVLDVLLRELSRSGARSLLLNLEDLWLETEAQNVPGTTERPNWRRKARLTLEDLQRSEPVGRRIEIVASARAGRQ